MIHYKCRDCGEVDAVYVEGVRISWNAHEQDWDIDHGPGLDQRCSDCQSWNVEEYEEESSGHA